MLTEAERRRYANEIGDVWAMSLPHCYKAARGTVHVCSSVTCTIHHVSGWVATVDGGVRVYVRGRTTKPPSRAQNVVAIEEVFVCAETGSVHVCDGGCTADKYTNKRKNVVCTISGLETRGKVYAESRSKKKRRKRAKPWDDDVAAMETVRLLLFSDVRLDLERSRLLAAHKKAQSSCVSYMKRTSLPCLLDLTKLYARHVREATYSRGYLMWRDDVLRENTQTVYEKRYARILRQSWSLMTDQLDLPSVRWNEFVVVALYIFSSGVSFQSDCIVPRDFVLHKVLPLTCHLDRFGINKRSFTNTKNISIDRIRSACAAGRTAELRRAFEEFLEGS